MKAVRLYAQVLVDVLTAPGARYTLESATRELNGFSALVQGSPLMLKVFDNPVLSEEEKSKALKGFTQKLDLSQISEKFLSMLMKRNRIGLLSSILNEVEAIQIQKSGGMMGEVVSAVPLSSEAVTSITQAISNKINKKIVLKEKVDPSLIAGMRVTVGGVTFDGSVQTKLNQVKNLFQ